jgi:tRNA 2-thiouridine synthesizing protein A
VQREFPLAKLRGEYACLPQQNSSQAAADGSAERMTETVMNLRGLKCPLPALRVRKKLSMLKSGDTIVAECTDPLTMIDIPNLLRQTGDALESKSDADGVLTFRIRKT